MTTTTTTETMAAAGFSLTQSTSPYGRHYVFLFAFLLLFILPADALSLEDSSQSRRRRDLLLKKIPIVGIGGAVVVYGKLVSDAFQKLSRGELVYPDDHERRVAQTIATAMQATGGGAFPLKILEVGMGKDCRVIRRNLYQEGYASVAGSTKGIQLYGVDISAPSDQVKEQASSKLQELDEQYQTQTTFDFVEGSISQPLPFKDGYFDCIISSLTLCSVDDQTKALQEIRRLLRPNGGTFGYIEHTAVLPDEPYRFLELQQQLLDPLQQAVADNCHLHRYTDANIQEVFGTDSKIITRERYLVEGMWPVSCQACGVIQRLQS